MEHTQSGATDAGAALEGVQVIDLTRLLPGPFATHHLQRMGAHVVKIEEPGVGDYARTMLRSAADAAADQPSLFFRLLNEGKDQRRLNLTQPNDRDALLELIRTADVLVEGFRPGVMKRLGLGWDLLHEINPRLIVCSISGYGQCGPYAHRAGHDINYIGYAGVLDQIATFDGDIALPNFQIGDLFGGTQAAVSAILAALFAVGRTGVGTYIDLSMAHVVHEHNLFARLAVERRGHAPRPGRDLLTGGVPCYAAYRTRDDRWMAVGALELKFWQQACEVLGRPEWATRHWMLGQAIAGEDAMALRAEMAAVFATRDQEDWIRLFDACDCCVTPVLRMEEAMHHPLFAKSTAAGRDDEIAVCVE